MQTCPLPKHPAETGIHNRSPDLAQLEGAHLLANEVRGFLVGCRFSDQQILEWARCYIAEEGSGDVESFVAWIHDCEGAT
ncbi:MAG: hypothetical protein GY926_07240 [bacterium]|nr:hypothetical protein [bacterium]